MTQLFKYYLHDQSNSYEFRQNLMDQGVELSEESWDNIVRPFYEIAFNCSVDDDGTVHILNDAEEERDALVAIVEGCITSFGKLSKSAQDKQKLLAEMLADPIAFTESIDGKDVQ